MLSQLEKCLDTEFSLQYVSRMAYLDRVFHSLSMSTSRAIIAQLANGPASIGNLARRHHMALPSFMKHVRVLLESEIVVLFAKWVRSPPVRAAS